MVEMSRPPGRCERSKTGQANSSLINTIEPKGL